MQYIHGDTNGKSYGENLLDLRRQFIAERDEMLGYQKKFSAEPEYARFFKGEARDRMKLYRVVCVMIPDHVPEPPGDCKRAIGKWPSEIEAASIIVDAMATTRTLGPVYNNPEN